MVPYGSYFTLRIATPVEYIARIDCSNDLFGDDARIEGVSKIDGNIGIASSQDAIKGTIPELREIKAFIIGLGFYQIDPAAIDNAHAADKTWFHPVSGFLVSDVKPDNFKKDTKGRIIPIDLVVQHALPGSDLHVAASGNMLPN